MNLLDVMQIGAAASRRVAAVILVVLVVGTIWFHSETTNLLYGQALDTAVRATSSITDSWGIRCTVDQDGLLAPPAVVCK